MQWLKDLEAGEDLAEIEDTDTLGNERGLTYPMIVGTGLSPAIGNYKQQDGKNSDEGIAQQTQQHIPVQQMRPEFRPRMQLLKL